MTRMLRSLASVVVAALLAGCTMTMTEDMIFMPPHAVPAPSADTMRMDDEALLTDPESEWVSRSRFEGLLPATVEHGFLRPRTNEGAYTIIRANGNLDADRPLIVSCYGTGGDRPNHGVYYAEKLLPWGDVIQFDYPGYGDSSGKPTIAGISDIGRDVVAMADQMAADRPLIFWGHSLGGFVCPHFVAMSKEADAMVYEATALNSEEAGQEWAPWFMRMLPIRFEPDESLDGGDNAAPLKGFEGPVLVLAGGEDKVLPAWLSRSLFSALEAQGNDASLFEFPQGSHTDIPLQADFAAVAGPRISSIEDWN